MATIAEMAARFQKFDMLRECMGVINDTRPQIVLTQQDQLWHGKDKEGKSLRPYRSDAYAAEKKEMNPLGVTDLKYTGEFYAGMFVDVGGDYFELNSDDSKADDLTAKYGNIWGLNVEGRTKYIAEAFMPRLKGRIEEKLKLLLE